jgi:PKD repeat protein
MNIMKTISSAIRNSFGKITIGLFVFVNISISPLAQTNYQFTAMSGAFAPLVGKTTESSIQVDEGRSNSINLGFNFTFNGINYSQVIASSNGYLSFNPNPNYGNKSDLSNSSNRPFIAAISDDLSGNVGSAGYQLSGTAPNRVFTFEWLNWKWGSNASAAGISFQVKLYETSNRIEFIYRQEAGVLNNAYASIGLAFQNSNEFLSVNGSDTDPTASNLTETYDISAKPATGQIYRFNYVINPEPTNHVTSFTAVGQDLSLSLNWTDATGTQPPDGYLILASKSGSFTNPLDGTDVQNDYDLSDGTGAVKIKLGLQNYGGWSGFESGTTYYFQIYPYTNNGININYKTGSPIPASHYAMPIFFKQVFVADINFGPTVAWGDFNNNDSLDFISTDNEGYYSIVKTALYLNKSGDNFEMYNVFNDGVSYGSLNIGDYNKDGDLDLLMAGVSNVKDQYKYTGSSWIAKNNGDSTFSDIASFGSFHNGENQIYQGDYLFNNGLVSWADFDMDGDMDCILTGKDDIREPHTQIYLSNNNQFVKSEIKLKGGNSLAVADYNNDNYPDVLVSGIDINGYHHTSLYKNNGNGTFTIQAGLNTNNKSYKNLSWGDYDNDGQLDLLLDNKVFKNNGNNIFTEQAAIAIPVLPGKVGSSFVDYNNDGYLDIHAEKIYINNKNNTFTALSDIVPYGLWGDYDSDGDLDILNPEGIFKNPGNSHNTKPQVPENLHHEIIGNQVRLSWDPSTDAQTPSQGLSYNVHIWVKGFDGKNIDIVLPLSDTITGVLKVPGYGNTFLNRTFIINDLHPGTYHWNVQTVDNGFLASGFSKSEQFTILPAFTEVYGGISIYTLQSYLNEYFAACADYDNDGDMDLILNGQEFSDGYSIYNNNGHGTFEEQLHLLEFGSGAWGDYNNDGLIDLYFNSKIYKNEGNNQMIEQTGILSDTLSESPLGQTFWGDYENDGDLDLLLGLKIFRNNGNNSFNIQDQTGLPLVAAACSWGDFDSDGDLDIILSSKDLGTRFYINDGNGYFKELIDNTMVIVSFGIIVSSDFDSDGDLDILIAGNSKFEQGSVNTLSIYKNEGNFNYKEIDTEIRKVSLSSASWGDFDNDGYQDLSIIGRSVEAVISKLYKNNKNGSFSEFRSFTGMERGSTIWGDFDNDKDLDLFSIGVDYKAYDILEFNANNTNFTNFLPTAPTNIKSQLNGFDMKLSWDKATDPNFSDGSIYYNLRVGTKPGGIETVSPMSDLISGQRRIPAIGNAHCNTFGIIKNMKPGTYYWSVQGIDQSFTGGPWAAEQSFIIPNISASFDADTVCFGSLTSFKDRSLGEGINSWNWDFGDGNTSTEQNPTHTYLIAGNYQVSLTIHSALYEHTITKNTVVKFGPQADFSIIRKPGLVCQFTNLTDVNAQNVTHWEWNFGDDSTAASKFIPLYEYKTDGQYQVSLKVQTENGCVDSVSKSNLVCSSGIEIPELYVRGPNVWYFAASNDSVSNYKWYRNDVLVQDSDQYIYVANQELGTYYVEINNGGECWVSSAKITIPDDFNSGKAKKMAKISKLKGSQNSAMLFPNPNKGKFTLLIDNEYKGKLLINIKDLSGKTLRQYYADKTESFYVEEMDLSKYGKGIYFIEINYGDKRESVKVVLE